MSLQKKQSVAVMPSSSLSDSLSDSLSGMAGMAGMEGMADMADRQVDARWRMV